MTDWKPGGIEVDQPNPQPPGLPEAPLEQSPPDETEVADLQSEDLPATVPPAAEDAPDTVAVGDAPGAEPGPILPEAAPPASPAPPAASQIPLPVPEGSRLLDSQGPGPPTAGAEESVAVLAPAGALGGAPVEEPSESLLGADADATIVSEDAPGPAMTYVETARSRPLPRAVAVANQKGGVGKTTTAVNLGAGLAELGYRVLVVDLDPQGNATTGLGINPRNLTGSVYDVLMNDAPLEDCIEPTAVRNLFVVPATIDLAGAEIELVPAFSRELKLRRAIDRLAGEFDFTLIDCPPSLGLLTVNGLAAAGEVLVPIQCEYYALEGLGQLIKNIQLVQSNLNPRLELSTIVLTMYDARTRLSDQVAKDVREHFGARVCRTIVPRTVRLSEAPSFGQPINVFDPSSRGATAYRELAKEVSGGTARRSG